MSTITSIYNSLPTVEEANEKFDNRAHVFSQLATLLAPYEHKFGVCLVHAHCKLKEGEVMVSSGRISQPECNVDCYPERWLASGEPYEFTKEPTVSPPPELFSEFQNIVHKIGVLGLYAVSGVPSSGIALEWTEGRTNYTEIRAAADTGSNNIETAWLPGTDHPVTMECTGVCYLDNQGNHQSHKPTPKA